MIQLTHKVTCDRCLHVSETDISEIIEGNIEFAAHALTTLPDKWTIYLNRHLCETCSQQMRELLERTPSYD